jgi:hypothetical protein
MDEPITFSCKRIVFEDGHNLDELIRNMEVESEDSWRNIKSLYFFQKHADKTILIDLDKLHSILVLCQKRNITCLTLSNIEFVSFSQCEDRKTVNFEFKFCLIEFIMVHCNHHEISHFLNKYQELNIRHIEIHCGFMSFRPFTISKENYFTLSLNVKANRKLTLPVPGTTLPIKGTSKIRNREYFLKINKAFKLEKADKDEFFDVFKTIPGNYDLKLNEIEGGHFKKFFNIILARNNLIYNNCQKACLSVLMFWKRKDNQLKVLPKDLIKYIVEIIWETRFDPIWNTSLIP